MDILTYADIVAKYPQCETDLALVGADADSMFTETVEPMSAWTHHVATIENLIRDDSPHPEHPDRVNRIVASLKAGEPQYPIFCDGRDVEGNHRLVAFHTLGLENVTVIRLWYETKHAHNRKDIPAGTRFDKLTVVNPTGTTRSRVVIYQCVCDCGETSRVSGQDLRRGHSTQCRACGRAATTKKLTGRIDKAKAAARAAAKSVKSAKAKAEHAARVAAAKATRELAKRVTLCQVCGNMFAWVQYDGLTPRRNCSRECYDKRKATVSAGRARAREHHVTVIESVDAYDILERDGWVCQRCGLPAPRHLRGSNVSLSPEVDHIIPLDMNGSHTDANCQCVHRKCNREKRIEVETGEAYDAIVALPLS